MPRAIASDRLKSAGPMLHFGWLGLLLLLALAVPRGAAAEDIDIFATRFGNNDLPNVLILWDSSANWSSSIPVPDCSFADGSGGPKATSPDKEQGTKFGIEKCAIYNVIHALPVNADGSARFNVALMLFNESGAPQGGYPRKQFLPLNSANKAALKNTIRNIAIGADKANNGPYTQALYEAYLMFMKAVPYQGTMGAKWDPAAVSGGRYVGPPGSGCGNNHIILVSNGSPNENNTAAKALLTGVNADTTQLTYPSSYITNSDQADWADELARFMRTVDVSTQDGTQAITTHAVAVIGASSDGLYPNFIRSIAKQGGGQYSAASSVTQLTISLNNVFNAIQAVNSVFASASLPISVNAQGAFGNQVFVGMFRPDATAKPRWPGNLKQYQIRYNAATDSLSLADSVGRAAINAATGFFVPSAISYWTVDSNFWVNNPMGTPPSANDIPDGEVVEKGAVGEQLHLSYATDQSNRPVYTCLACASGTRLGSGSALRFESGNAGITSAALATTDVDRPNLINWVRGTDNAADEFGPGGSVTVRPSIHGDVLHSRPVVVDYGGSTGVIVFYGANDGMIHAVDGNRSGSSAGDELWAFVPQEFFPRLKRLRDNTPGVLLSTTPAGTGATPRDYFADGSLAVFQRRDASGNTVQVIIYATMRRGGRFLYAFDVTDPRDPRFLWKKSNADYGVLGQTWSEPAIAYVRGRVNPVLVMGAGYDPVSEDVTPVTSPTMGNAVLVLDALDGSLVKSFATTRSVPAAVTLMDSDYDGYVDRAYAVDIGATVYRIDFETSDGLVDAGNWTIRTFAILADAGSTRKFFYAPDIVQTASFTAVLVGSGNRENPLLGTTNDRFYTLLDYKTTKGTPSSSAIDNSVLARNDGTMAAGGAGCYLPLDPGGEKVVTKAVTTGGYSYFSTNRPSPPANACVANLGVAKTYRLPLFCGVEASIELAGGGLPPSPVTGTVLVSVPPVSGSGPSTTRAIPFIIGGFNPERSGLAVSRVPINVDGTRRRTYWYKNNAH